MKISGLGQRALKKTILAALLLGSVNAAHAAINIDVSFDGTNTLMEVTGSWDNFTFYTDQAGQFGKANTEWGK